MRTYTTLDGDVLDLSELPPEMETFFERCLASYQDNKAWAEFANWVNGSDNPLLHPAEGLITRAVLDHPLYAALDDLAARLGIRQGLFAPAAGDDAAREPLADEWLPLDEAAARKGVAVAELKRAIWRGRVLATPGGPDHPSRLVSANSLACWTPRGARPTAAGKRAAQRAS